MSETTIVTVIKLPRLPGEKPQDAAHRVFDRLSRFSRLLHVVAGPDKSGGWRVAIRRIRAGEVKS